MPASLPQTAGVTEPSRSPPSGVPPSEAPEEAVEDVGGAVGDDAVDAQVDDELYVGGFVDGPHVHPVSPLLYPPHEPGVLAQHVDARTGDTGAEGQGAVAVERGYPVHQVHGRQSVG